jgi:hypothetical protein
MDWSVKAADATNHNPRLTLNGVPGRAPVRLAARVGEPLELDATGSTDPDGDALSFLWLVYPEAGSGVPGHPVATDRRALFGGDWRFGESSGPPTLVPRVELKDAETPVATAIPRVPGTTHVILIVEDDGSPRLTSYRRAILEIAAADE